MDATGSINNEENECIESIENEEDVALSSANDSFNT